jgi:hypothetical protein
VGRIKASRKLRFSFGLPGLPAPAFGEIPCMFITGRDIEWLTSLRKVWWRYYLPELLRVLRGRNLDANRAERPPRVAQILTFPPAKD